MAELSVTLIPAKVLVDGTYKIRIRVRCSGHFITIY